MANSTDDLKQSYVNFTCLHLSTIIDLPSKTEIYRRYQCSSKKSKHFLCSRYSVCWLRNRLGHVYTFFRISCNILYTSIVYSVQCTRYIYTYQIPIKYNTFIHTYIYHAYQIISEQWLQTYTLSLLLSTVTLLSYQLGRFN